MRLFVILSFLLLAIGCESKVQLPAGALALRIVANSTDHADLIAKANGQSAHQVKEKGRIVAQWYPIAESSKATHQILDDESLSIRNRDGTTEILVIHSDLDLSENHVERVLLGDRDAVGQPVVSIGVDAKGSYLLGQLTEQNLSRQNDEARRAAIIVHGNVVSVPQIFGKITDRFVISTSGSKQADSIVRSFGLTPEEVRR